jgi:calcineurin-like phosphoesterase family protein
MFSTETQQILNKIDLNTWIISDLHIGHENISKFEPVRLTQMGNDGFVNHDDWIVNIWNIHIKEDDVVLLLGDAAFKKLSMLEQLNGHIIFILGNHDRKGHQSYNNFAKVVKGFIHKDLSGRYSVVDTVDELFSCLVMDVGDSRVLFSHYPCTTTEHRFGNQRINNRVDALIDIYHEYNCNLNIHGHTHSKDVVDTSSEVKFKNVSFEAIGMKPVKLGDLLK